MTAADYLKQIAIIDNEEMPEPGQPDNGYDWRRRSEKQERLARAALSDLQAQGEGSYTKQEVEAMLKEIDSALTITMDGERITDPSIIWQCIGQVARKHGLNTTTHV